MMSIPVRINGNLLVIVILEPKPYGITPPALDNLPQISFVIVLTAWLLLIKTEYVMTSASAANPAVRVNCLAVITHLMPQ